MSDEADQDNETDVREDAVTVSADGGVGAVVSADAVNAQGAVVAAIQAGTEVCPAAPYAATADWLLVPHRRGLNPAEVADGVPAATPFLNHASSLIALVRCSEAPSGIVTWALVPVKLSAVPYLPIPPRASTMLVPDPSSNANAATSPGVPAPVVGKTKQTTSAATTSVRASERKNRDDSSLVELPAATFLFPTSLSKQRGRRPDASQSSKNIPPDRPVRRRRSRLHHQP